MKRILRLVYVGGFILCVLGFFGMRVVTKDFVNAPTNPDVNSGRVVPWNNHGTYHYITNNDDFFLVSLQGFCVAMFLLAVGALIMERNRK